MQKPRMQKPRMQKPRRQKPRDGSHMGTDNDPFGVAEAAAAAILRCTGGKAPQAAVVLGSGWQGVADALGRVDAELATSDLPGFIPPTVPGHAGYIRAVDVAGRRTLVLLGRLHLYEGHSPTDIVHGVRSAILAGATTVVLTNAAGGLDPQLPPGTPVLMSDHLNLTGVSPLTGSPPPAGYGSRFVDLTTCYSPSLRAAARDAHPGLTEAVYAGLPGPTFETPAEIAMLGLLGAGLVGMSTVLEAIASRHLGAQVLGLSLVTNLAAGLSPTPLDHAEVVAAGTAATATMASIVSAVVANPDP